MTMDGAHSKIAFQQQIFEELVRQFAAVQGDPTEGEIWRTSWGATAQLVTVTEARADGVLACPLSYDVALGDDSAVLVAATEQSLGYDVVAWTRLQRRLPMFVLDVKLGEVSANALVGFRNEVGVGAPITSVLDERSQVRDVIDERLARLASASWQPSTASDFDLEGAVRAMGYSPSDISNILGIEPGAASSLIRGTRVLTQEQAERLAPLLSVDITDILDNVKLDPSLILEIDRPCFRRRLWEVGQREGATDEGDWRFQVASERLALAARTTGAATDRQRWAGLIEVFLSGH